MQDYERPLFGTSLGQTKSSEEVDQQISQMLCLPVSVGELLQANSPAGVGVPFLWASQKIVWATGALITLYLVCTNLF